MALKVVPLGSGAGGGGGSAPAGGGLRVTSAAASGGGDGGIVGGLENLGGDVASVLGKALGVVDLPRSAIVAGLDQISANPRGGFVKDVKNHIGFGDYINGGPLADANPWVKRIAGFAGDVVLDPLTYLTGGAEVLAKAPEALKALEVADQGGRIARKGEVVARLLDIGEKDAAREVLRSGVNSVPRDIAERAGLDLKGLRLATPLGDISVGGNAAAEKLAELRGGLRDVTNKSETLRSLKGVLNPGGRAGAELAMADPLAAHIKQLGERQTRALARSVPRDLLKGLAEVQSKFPEVDPEALAHAVETGVTKESLAAAAGGIEHVPAESLRLADAAAAARTWQEGVAQAVEKHTGRNISRLADYLPHVATDEFKQMLTESGGKLSKGDMGHFLQRSLKEGEQFLGHTLTKEDVTVQGINKLLAEHFGEDATKMFRQNFFDAGTGYVDWARRSIQREGLAHFLSTPAGGELVQKLTESPTELMAKAGGKVDTATAALDKLYGKKIPAAEAAAEKAANDVRLGADKLAARGAADSLKPSIAEAKAAVRAHGAELKDVQAQIDKLHATADRLMARGASRPRVDAALAKLDQMEARHADLLAKAEPFRQALEAATSPGAVGWEPERNADVLRTLGGEAALNKLPKAEQAVKLAAAQATSAQAVFDSASSALVDRVSELEQRAQVLADAKAAFLEPAHAASVGRQEALIGEALRLEKAANGGPQDLAAFARLESRAMEAQANLEALGPKADSWTKSLEYWGSRHGEAQAMDAQYGAMRAFAKSNGGAAYYASDALATALEQTAQFVQPGDAERFLRKYYDPIMSAWKAMSLLSPGFHERNYLGGLWNNTFDGVKVESHTNFARAWNVWRQGGDVAERWGPRAAEAFDHMEAFDIFQQYGQDFGDLYGAAGQSEAAAVDRGSKAANAVHAVTDKIVNNPVMEANRKAGNFVETQLRGSMFWEHFMVRGESASQAFETVVHYHFDYDELSKVESSVLKRITPFYTWTRKNFPLQLEMMATRPGYFTTYLHAASNVGNGVPTPGVVPAYYKELTGFKTPFTNGGGAVFATLDLPFNNMLKQFSPEQQLASLSPIIKTPLELWAGKQAFSDQPFTGRPVGVPDSWLFAAVPLHYLEAIPGLKGLPGIHQMPQVFRDSQGHWVMTDRDAYKMEQALPVLGKLRRNLPRGDRDLEARAWTSWISFFTGVSVRTLTDAQVQAELRRRLRQSATTTAASTAIANFSTTPGKTK